MERFEINAEQATQLKIGYCENTDGAETCDVETAADFTTLVDEISEGAKVSIIAEIKANPMLVGQVNSLK